MPEMLIMNPAKRRKKRVTAKKRPATRRKRVVRRASPAKAKRVARRKYRRNPSGRLGAQIKSMVMGGALGGAGAVATDVLFDKLPLPMSMKMGMQGNAVKGAISVALGVVAHKSKMVKPEMANAIGTGGLAVQMHSTLSGMLPASIAPSPTVQGLGNFYAESIEQLPEYPAMGEVFSGDYVSMGEVFNSDPYAQ